MKRYQKNICVFLAMSLLASSAWADSARETTTMESMTVTAQKTEELAQDVPIAMSVFDDLTLDDREIDDLEGINNYVPNFYLLNMTDTAVATPSMRGLMGFPESFSTTVGLYADGVPLTSNIGFNTVFEDIERVEVLRGPQSTLYGKGAEAGVINVITKKPDNNKDAKFRVEYGEDNKQELGLSYRGPIQKDKLYIGLSGRYFSQDGFYKDTIIGENTDDRKNYFGKIYLRATPTNRLEASVISSYYETDDGNYRVNSLTAANPREHQSNFKGFSRFSDQNHALKIKYSFDDFDIESTSSFKESIDKRKADLDFTQMEIFHYEVNMPHRTLAEEFRVNGKIRKLGYLTGLYLSENTVGGGYTVDSFIPGLAGNYHSDTKQDTIGIFTHFDYAITANINILAGIRYDKDEVKIDDYSSAYSNSKTFNNVSPKIALEYTFHKNLMTYATVAKGYKSGGYYIMAPDGYQKDYDSETLWNFEIGLKALLFAERVNLNANLYYMDVDDLQVMTAINAFQGYISNAAEATSKGFELEANYMVTKDIGLLTSLGVNETKFDKFSDFNGDHSGKYNPYAPKYSYAVGLQYRPSYGLFARLDCLGYGAMYLNSSNTLKRDAYGLVNFKIGYEANKFDTYLYGKNIFDKNYDTIFIEESVILSSPREIGVRFNYRF